MTGGCGLRWIAGPRRLGHVVHEPAEGGIQLGSGDVAELVIDVDRTFTPGGSDTRELGIQIFHTFIDPK